MQVFATKMGEQFSQRAVMVAQRNWELRNLTIKSDKFFQEDGRAAQPKDYMLKKHGSGGGSVKLGAQELDNQIRQVFAFGEQFCGGSVKLEHKNLTIRD